MDVMEGQSMDVMKGNSKGFDEDEEEGESSRYLHVIEFDPFPITRLCKNIKTNKYLSIVEFDPVPIARTTTPEPLPRVDQEEITASKKQRSQQYESEGKRRNAALIHNFIWASMVDDAAADVFRDAPGSVQSYIAATFNWNRCRNASASLVVEVRRCTRARRCTWGRVSRFQN